MPELMPEPPFGAALYWPATDADEADLLMVRNDRLAQQLPDAKGHWFIANDPKHQGAPWIEVCEGVETSDYDWADLMVLLPPAEVDRRVREAVDRVQLRVVGDHIIEAAGYCRTHAVTHSPEEIARAEDRLEEDRCDDR